MGSVGPPPKKRKAKKVIKSIESRKALNVNPSQLDVYMGPFDQRRESVKPKKKKLRHKRPSINKELVMTDDNSQKTYKVKEPLVASP